MKSRLRIVIGSILLCLANAAWAQLRAIPEDVRRGWLSHIQETLISIDNTPVQLAPGGTIRNQQNLIVVPASLPPGGALAEFQLDASGQVARAWLLTPEEAARERPRR
ncbi:MAG: hypothetical protein EXR28_07290 [Betaproteobacteria bacterium]|nr:hypothetical protein [Betaproteobacteria bacterium]